MPNATQLLRQDHTKVKGLFNKFDQAKGADAQRRVAEQVMSELEVHTKIEEEIFYPAVKKAIEEGELIDEAKQEHQQAKGLISELKKMRGRNDGEGGDFESKFAELVQAIQHHVEEEEGEMFPKAEESDLDLADLGAQMAERKQDLMTQMGAADSAAAPAKSKSKTKARAKPRVKVKAKLNLNRRDRRKRARPQRGKTRAAAGRGRSGEAPHDGRGARVAPILAA